MRIILATMVASLMMVLPVDAGIISKAGKFGREMVEKTITIAVPRADEASAAAKAIRLQVKPHPDLADAITAAIKNKSPQETMAFVSLLKQSKVLIGLSKEEADTALAFLSKTGKEGAFVLGQFGWQGVKKYHLDAPDAAMVVKEAGQLIAPGLGGSWRRLSEAMAQAKLVGRDRDFAETLFQNRARANRQSGLENVELFPGQFDGVHGIDFIGIGPDNRIKVIEFSTGAKPERAPRLSGAQMGWNWTTENLKKFLETASPDMKINLRKKGFPNDLIIDPSRVTIHRVMELVDREIYATKLNSAAYNRLESGVKFVCLEIHAQCKIAA
jgi:hypothetical protein